MKRVQITLDKDLLIKVDKLVKKLGTTRSKFTRSALRDALIIYNVSNLEEKHIKGYENYTVKEAEFEIW